MKYYCESSERVLSELNTSKSGLSSEQAQRRLAENGKNALEAGKTKSILRRFLEELADPMTIILLVAALISGALAIYEMMVHPETAEGFTDVIIILAVVIINAVLGVYQESKAEKAIEALQEMSGATSKVIRDGKLQVIKSEDLVVGDIIVLEAGDAVAADARIIECASLQAEEAALTGESVPVNKLIDAIYLRETEADVPLGDRKNMLYMGSTVVYGRGVAVVTATGMQTEMGKIAGALSDAADSETPLQKKLHQLSKILTWLVLGICVLVFGVQLIRHADNLQFEVALDAFMIAVSLAVAAIPEGLAAVVTVVLSIGVTNMSKRNAIIRKLTAVETLGCAQIICSDKTGTLTQNKMTVVDFFGEDENLIAKAMALSSDAETDENGEVTGEPTEAALVAYANRLGINKNLLKSDYPRVMEAPFDSARKMMSTVHKTSDGIIQYTKGAPDVVVDRCTHYLENGKIVAMTDEYRSSIIEANRSMAAKALRVLASAMRIHSDLPESSEPETLENGLCFVGLVGMIDPVRPEVKAAIEECRTAGIRPIMITGDHVDTAVAIAKELGIIEDESGAMTGAKLNELSDEEFEGVFRNISVYARVQPEHKTRIVTAWKNAGFVTAMTGDGVNDAPSIKTADIGVGMGITGTDVTKNVADMVLADDNFATIVGAVEEGRRIYDNIRKAIQFLLGSNLSEVLCIFIATLIGFTVLEPVHLLWINLVTDSLPALALGMEKAECGIMRRKPRSTKEGIFSDGLGVNVVYQGALVTALVLTSYFIGATIAPMDAAEHGMTMAFLTLSMAEIFHSINMRSVKESVFTMDSHNKFLYLAAFGSLVLTTLVCEIPFIANAFGFTSIGVAEYLIALGLGAVVIPVVELVKFIKRRLAKKSVKSA